MAEASEMEGILREHDMIRREILHFDRTVLEVVSITLGLIGIIIAQGVAASDPYIFIIPPPLLTMVSLYVADKRWFVRVLATYQKQYIEARHPGLKWETRLDAFREACRRKGRRLVPMENIIKIEYVFFLLLALLSLGLFIEAGLRRPLSPWEYVLAAVVFLLCAAVMTRTFRRLLRACSSEMADLWPDAV